jgi:uncharacterized protein (TIGR02145 family)
VFLIKASLAGLIGVALCMANISGTVTDTGTAPIGGVVVQLEKGGQKDTTEDDGSFTLVLGSTSILPGNGKALPNDLYAGISGNLMTVKIAQRAAVEIAAFDLSGKALSTVRKIMDAGSHSISLPYKGAGIYLYKVQSGNRECLLKGNGFCGISSSITVYSQGSTSNKSAKITAAINDIIAATKDGLLNYRCVITRNDDTCGVIIKMIANAGNITDVDGNVYQTVRIGNQVWMAENLRVTKYNDGSDIPLTTSASNWIYSAPKYCFYKNITNADSVRKYGALYNWFVLSSANPKNIAPTGWHVPTNAEWDTLQNYLIRKGYNWDGTTTGNKIAKSLAAQTDWPTQDTTPGGVYRLIGSIGAGLTMNNKTGFSGLPGGARHENGTFVSQSNTGYWWSATEYDASFAPYYYLDGNIYPGDDDLICYSTRKQWGFSIRLVRGY